MSLSPEELALAKAQLSRLNTRRIEKIVAEAFGKTLTHEPKPLPKQPADVSKRKYVRQIRKGCSGINHGSFLNR
tara:strand:- start:131 stop:352 length:222 start_codon:yes stop_codon:yes gene_type:complete